METKHFYIFTLFFIIIGCKSTPKMAQTQTNFNFWVGTYTNPGYSKSEGIYQFNFQENGTITPKGLAVKDNNPTFLTYSSDHQYLLACNSENEGEVTSYKIEKDNLLILSKSKAGKNPCFINTNQQNQVITANYQSGNITLFQLQKNGVLSTALDSLQHNITQHSNHLRQLEPHAHSCYFEPHSNNLITIDLGADKLCFSTIIAQKIIPNQFSHLQFPPGFGPRVLSFHPSQPWIYVVNELNGYISFIKKDTIQNSYQIIKHYPTLPTDFKGENLAAHIEISKDGQYLYMTNRGLDAISVYKIENDGLLNFVQQTNTHGKHPRHFAFTPDEKWLLIANRDDHKICVFKRDALTGLVTYHDYINCERPVCILF